MAKPTYQELIETCREAEDKKILSDELAILVQEINESADPDGNVELVLTRTKKVFKFTALTLVNALSSKKTQADTAIDAVLSKVTINGK